MKTKPMQEFSFIPGWFVKILWEWELINLSAETTDVYDTHPWAETYLYYGSLAVQLSEFCSLTVEYMVIIVTLQ